MNIHSLNLPQWLVLTVGFGGQALFSMRFIVQWLASERARRSVVPVVFWYFSLGGGILLLVYALYREDPVFVFGQAAGLVIYVRNLWLIRNQGPAADHLNESAAAK